MWAKAKVVRLRMHGSTLHSLVRIQVYAKLYGCSGVFGEDELWIRATRTLATHGLPSSLSRILCQNSPKARGILQRFSYDSDLPLHKLRKFRSPNLWMRFYPWEVRVEPLFDHGLLVHCRSKHTFRGFTDNRSSSGKLSRTYERFTWRVPGLLGFDP